MQIVIHPETRLSVEAVGSIVAGYHPNFQSDEYFNPHYNWLAAPPASELLKLTAPGILEREEGQVIEGWLWPVDARKPCEMAYFAKGDILELGTYRGLSTCITARAIDFHLGDAVDHVQKLASAQRRFAFAFVDHSHTCQNMANLCPLLPSVLMPGSFVQFDDYNDPRNGKISD